MLSKPVLCDTRKSKHTADGEKKAVEASRLMGLCSNSDMKLEGQTAKFPGYSPSHNIYLYL